MIKNLYISCQLNFVLCLMSQTTFGATVAILMVALSQAVTWPGAGVFALKVNGIK